MSDEYIGNLYNGSTLKVSANVGIHRLIFSRSSHIFKKDNIFDVVVNEDDETVELECKFESNEFTINYADNTPHIPTFTEHIQQSSSVNDEYSNDFYKYDDHIEDIERNGDFMKKDYSKFGTIIKTFSIILTLIGFIAIAVAFFYIMHRIDIFSLYITGLTLTKVIRVFIIITFFILMFFFFTYGVGDYLENFKAEQENLLHNFDKILTTRLKESKAKQKTDSEK